MKFSLHCHGSHALLPAFTAGRLFGLVSRSASTICGDSGLLRPTRSTWRKFIRSTLTRPGPLNKDRAISFRTVSRVTTGNRFGRPAGEWTAAGRLNTARLNSGSRTAMDRRGRSGSGLREGPGVGSSIPSRSEPRQKPTGGNQTDTRTASQSNAPTLPDLLATAKGSQAFPAVYPPVRRG